MTVKAPPNAGRSSSLPVDCSELLSCFREAKPEWSGAQRQQVFGKLSRIRIRESSSLCAAVFAEGDDSLNVRLRKAGEKGFTLETLKAFENYFLNLGIGTPIPLSNAAFTETSMQKTKGILRPLKGSSDTPNWDTPAPAGWWRVACPPCTWGYAAPSFEAAKTSVHCMGKLLAMSESRYVWGSYWLKSRDDRIGGEQWFPVDVTMAAVETLENRYGIQLEQVCSDTESPPLESRAAHALVVKAFDLAVKKKTTIAEQKRAILDLGQRDKNLLDYLFPLVHASYSVVTSKGCPTNSYAFIPMPAPLQSPHKHKLEAELLNKGFVIIDDCASADEIAKFVREISLADECGHLQPADPHQLTTGQRDDRISWVDDTMTARYWPAISRAIAMLKGAAHALNPVMSSYHADRLAVGDPAYTAPLAPPATVEAVLTVPAKAMVSTYPGNGAKYIPHTDNHWRAAAGCRANPRELTAIIYANPPDWNPARDGGALRIYPNSQGCEACPEPVDTCVVEPFGGRMVVFFSDLWHEVMPAWRVRRATTLWIFRPTAQ